MTVVVELYGRLREHGGSLTLELPEGASAGSALAELGRRLGGAAAGAVLATESAVLASEDRLPSGRLAALPPVCGG